MPLIIKSNWRQINTTNSLLTNLLNLSRKCTSYHMYIHVIYLRIKYPWQRNANIYYCHCQKMLFTDINKYCLKIATDRAINTVISRPCAQCLSNILPDWSHMSNWPSMYSLYKLYGCLVVRTHVFRHLTNEQKPLYMSAVRWPEVLWNSLVFFVCNVINKLTIARTREL